MRKKLFKNTLILTASRLGSQLITFAFGIYLARRLGPVDFGKFTFATSFVLSFTALADFGMENYLLREISRNLAQRVKFLKNLFYPRIFFALLTYFLVLILGFGYGKEDFVNISIIGLILIPYSLYYFFQAYFNAQEKVGKSALIKVVGPTFYALLGVLALFLGFGYRGVFVSVFLSISVLILFLLYFYPQVWKVFRFSWVKIVRVMHKTWTFAALIFIAVLYLRIDVMILKLLGTSKMVGLYGPVSTLITASILIPQSFALALFPISSRLIESDRVALGRIYKKGILTLFLVSLPFVFAGFYLAPILTPVLFGNEYLFSVPALQVAFLSLVFFFVNALPGNVILNSRRVRGFVPLALANLMVNIFLNFLLIPRFSFVGSAWAKVGSEAFGFLVNNFYVMKVLRSD